MRSSINGGGYGQNLAYWGSSSGAEAVGAEVSVGRAASDWYNSEFNKFTQYGVDSPDMSNFGDWGHFSQLVWKNSQKLGCYTNLCKKGTLNANMDAWYTVCNYAPAGMCFSHAHIFSPTNPSVLRQLWRSIWQECRPSSG